jgi:hypothetical protein
VAGRGHRHADPDHADPLAQPLHIPPGQQGSALRVLVDAADTVVGAAAPSLDGAAGRSHDPAAPAGRRPSAAPSSTPWRIPG